MAGRGRGSNKTFTHEQLQALGCLGKDNMPQVSAVPPPQYPPMKEIRKLPKTEEIKQKISFRFENIYVINHSPAHMLPPDAKVAEMPHSWMINNPEKTKVKMDDTWKVTPLELWNAERKRKWKLEKKSKPTKKLKEVNVEEKLKLLEEKEKLDSQKQAEVPAKAESESEDEKELEDPQGDDEMDDENDYDNNYFDNGESYNEEDDHLDDGPVY